MILMGLIFVLIGWGGAASAIYMTHQTIKHDLPAIAWIAVILETCVALVGILLGLRLWSLL